MSHRAIAALAQLLIEVSTGSAAAKRKLRLALAGAQSPREAAREITKRLTSVARARSFITWKNRKALVTDLETQRRAIVEEIAPADPDEALALMWGSWRSPRPSSSAATTPAAPSSASSTRLAPIWVRLPGPRSLRPGCSPGGFSMRCRTTATASTAPALGDEGLAQLKTLAEELGRAPLPVPHKVRDDSDLCLFRPNPCYGETKSRP